MLLKPRVLLHTPGVKCFETTWRTRPHWHSTWCPSVLGGPFGDFVTVQLNRRCCRSGNYDSGLGRSVGWSVGRFLRLAAVLPTVMNEHKENPRLFGSSWWQHRSASVAQQSVTSVCLCAGVFWTRKAVLQLVKKLPEFNGTRKVPYFSRKSQSQYISLSLFSASGELTPRPARSTCSSRATCCPRWHFKWEKVSYLFLWQNRDRTPKQFWKRMSRLFMETHIAFLIYGVKNVLKAARSLA